MRLIFLYLLIRYRKDIIYSKLLMTIWDTHPDILDEDGNFNGYNPEDDLPPVDMETGTIVVHPEGEVFPPKRITDETVALLAKKHIF